MWFTLRVIALAILVPLLVTVSSIHYAGFLAAEWLHLYVFEPLEITLAAWIGKVWNGQSICVVMGRDRNDL